MLSNIDLDWSWIIESFGIIGLLFFAYIWIFKPVEKDRWMYGNKPLVMVAIISAFVCCFALSLCLVGEFFNSDKIVHWRDDDGPEKEAIEHWWAVISQFTDPGNLPSAYGKGRVIAFISAVSGIACLSGLLVSSIVNYLSRRSLKWKQGMIHYNRCFKDYVVIIGCNEQTANIVKLSLKRKDVKYILIQTRQDVEKMRMRLDLDLDKNEEDRLVFYFAERTSREDIEALHLEKAKEIYILGEDVHADNEEDHDVFNISCLENISEYFKHVILKDKKKVHVSLEYQSTFTAFKSTHIYKSLDKNVEFLPFNIHAIWAKKILVDNFAIVPVGKKGEVKVQNYIPIDSYDGIKADDDKTIHLVIVGMNQMGTALGVQTALLAHFPNAHRDKNLRTTITFIDDQAKKEGEYFRGRFATMFDLCRYRVVEIGKDICGKKEWYDPLSQDGDGRYKHLGENGNFMDIEWEFIQGNVASDEIRKYLVDVAQDKNKITTVAICFNHPQRSIAAALYLPEMVYRRALQILVYQQNSFDLANKVADGEKVWKRYEKLRPFGMIEGSYTEDAFDNSMAKILHFLYANNKIGIRNHGDNQQVTYQYQEIEDISSYEEIDFDFARKINNLWNQQGIVDKLSNIDMVDSIPMKLRSLGTTIDDISDFTSELKKGNNLELMAKAEHTRWLTERVTMNFRPLDNVEAEWLLFTNKDLDEKKRKKEKKFRKEKSRAHLDICSNTTLNEIDLGVHYNDIDVVCYIPQLLKYREWINVMRLADEKSRHSIAGKLLGDFVISKGDGGNHFAFKLIENGDKKFWMMETAVSQQQWESIMGNNPAQDNGTDKGQDDESLKEKKYVGSNLPVINVSKNDIEDFLKVLRKMTGLRFDLPTKEEWEYVARCTAEEITEKTRIEDAFRINKGKEGKKDRKGPWLVDDNKDLQRNSLGVYNMMGNVWEWTKESPEDNPSCYFFCGGSWRFRKLHSDIKGNYWYSFWKPILKSDDIGFRMVWRFDMRNIEADKEREVVDLLDKVATNPIDEQKTMSANDIVKLTGMIPVETGYFLMGTENNDTIGKYKNPLFPENWIDENADEEETPHHFVKINKFYISATPVTQKLWNAVMGIEAKMNPSDNLGDNKPQTNISWDMIKYQFLPKLEELTKLKFRLPTEAEWEYVAKGGHKTKICKELSKIFDNESMTVDEKQLAAYKYLAEEGHKYSMYSGTDDAMDLDLYIHSATAGVKDRMPNELGVYDMSGNIWEWCEDYYQTDFYNDCIEGKGDIAQQGKQDEYRTKGYITDPVCKDESYAAHTFRGGSFRFDAKSCRNTSVNFWIDTDTDDDLGFRLALDSSYESSLNGLIKGKE